MRKAVHARYPATRQLLSLIPLKMALLHDFGILHTADLLYPRSSVLRRMQQHVTLHDDLVRYLKDSLTWIPSYNPSRKVDQVGLNYYGQTVITKSGAGTAAAVFSTWASLFSLSGTELVLTGSYSWDDSRPPQNGRHEQLRFDRDNIVTILRTLASACNQVADGSGDEYILHLGI